MKRYGHLALGGTVSLLHAPLAPWPAHFRRQLLAKGAVALQVPFSAHGGAAVAANRWQS